MEDLLCAACCLDFSPDEDHGEDHPGTPRTPGGYRPGFGVDDAVVCLLHRSLAGCPLQEEPELPPPAEETEVFRSLQDTIKGLVIYISFHLF